MTLRNIASHTEIDWQPEELVRQVRLFEVELKDPEITPRHYEETEKRLGHLVFEYWARQNIDHTIPK